MSKNRKEQQTSYKPMKREKENNTPYSKPKDSKPKGRQFRPITQAEFAEISQDPAMFEAASAKTIEEDKSLYADLEIEKTAMELTGAHINPPTYVQPRPYTKPTVPPIDLSQLNSFLARMRSELSIYLPTSNEPDEQLEQTDAQQKVDSKPQNMDKNSEQLRIPSSSPPASFWSTPQGKESSLNPISQPLNKIPLNEQESEQTKHPSKYQTL